MKLIDGHAMIQRVEALHKRGAVDLSYYNIVKEAVQMEPSVDAAPVVHSFWHWTQDGFVYCENCTYPLARTKVNIDGEERHLYLTTNYCAHCGAKMDGERRDDDADD